MELVITRLSACPIRSKPEDSSEMTSQLLFGEKAVVLQSGKGSWVKVSCVHDDYVGWMDRKQLEPLRDPIVETSISIEASQIIFADNHSTYITMGAELPEFDGITAVINGTSFRFSGQAISPGHNHDSPVLLEKLARKLLNTPYLWGGRTTFGIDCSGFTQVLYKCLGIPLKRDSFDQATQGTVVDFFEQSLPGDLAFFTKESGVISHVGLILENREVIHASGKVRIDMIDHYGIFNQDIQEYTHRLKIIKRVLDSN